MSEQVNHDLSLSSLDLDLDSLDNLELEELESTLDDLERQIQDSYGQPDNSSDNDDLNLDLDSLDNLDMDDNSLGDIEDIEFDDSIDNSDDGTSDFFKALGYNQDSTGNWELPPDKQVNIDNLDTSLNDKNGTDGEDEDFSGEFFDDEEDGETLGIFDDSHFQTEDSIEDNTFADNDGSVIDGSELLSDDESEHSYSKILQSGDAVFSPDGGLRVMDDIDDSSNGFQLTYVDVSDIIPGTRIRKGTAWPELEKSIKETGLLHPITVAPTATDGKYVLLDGYRRLISCARCGKRVIPCVINLKVNTLDIKMVEPIYNQNKKYSIKEQIEYIDYLEKQKGIMSASMIEYLLQMFPGDYSKLKDILSDGDDEIISHLYDGTWDIATCFKKLEQRRKKESAEERELKKAVSAYQEDDGSLNNQGEDVSVGDTDGNTNEVLENLTMTASDLNEGLDDKQVEEMDAEANAIEGYKPHKQDPNHREILDPSRRKAILARDDNTCQVCKQIGGSYAVDLLDVHHIKEVYLGGDDADENLITCCLCCHKMIHLYGRGELHLPDFSTVTDADKVKFKKIIKLGGFIREGVAAKHLTKEKLKELDKAETIGRTKPGTGQQAT